MEKIAVFVDLLGTGVPEATSGPRTFSTEAFAAIMSGYVQSPLGNFEHGEHRHNESHTGHAEGRVE